MMALGTYSINVVLALAAMIFLIYPAILKIFTRTKVATFYKGILPAQMLAFSTSSSAATLPVTMDCAERNLGVAEEICSFDLPLGATINVDVTAIKHGVFVVLLAQAFRFAST